MGIKDSMSGLLNYVIVIVENGKGKEVKWSAVLFGHVMDWH